jgi:hypothetical protein
VGPGSGRQGAAQQDRRHLRVGTGRLRAGHPSGRAAEPGHPGAGRGCSARRPSHRRHSPPCRQRWRQPGSGNPSASASTRSTR